MSADAPFQMPTADEIFGRRLAPAPWRSSRPVLAVVFEMLPMIEDDLTAASILNTWPRISEQASK